MEIEINKRGRRLVEEKKNLALSIASLWGGQVDNRRIKFLKKQNQDKKKYIFFFFAKAYIQILPVLFAWIAAIYKTRIASCFYKNFLKGM